MRSAIEGMYAPDLCALRVVNLISKSAKPTLQGDDKESCSLDLIVPQGMGGGRLRGWEVWLPLVGPLQGGLRPREAT